MREWTIDLKTSSPLSVCPQIQAVATKEVNLSFLTYISPLTLSPHISPVNPSFLIYYITHNMTQPFTCPLLYHPPANPPHLSPIISPTRERSSSGPRRLKFTRLIASTLRKYFATYKGTSGIKMKYGDWRFTLRRINLRRREMMRRYDCGIQKRCSRWL